MFKVFTEIGMFYDKLQDKNAEIHENYALNSGIFFRNKSDKLHDLNIYTYIYIIIFTFVKFVKSLIIQQVKKVKCILLYY